MQSISKGPISGLGVSQKWFLAYACGTAVKRANGYVDMKLPIGSFILAALVAPLAHAEALSFVGSLAPDDPNDVFVTSFTLLLPSAVAIQTLNFGGGTNAAGTLIAAGGFDPYVSLFSGVGAGATFLASNDDGLCPPGHGAPACADSTLVTGLLAAGTYWR